MISFTIQGGQVGSSALDVTHQPSFTEGEVVLVFLYEYSAGSAYPSGSIVPVGGELGKTAARDYLSNCVPTTVAATG